MYPFINLSKGRSKLSFRIFCVNLLMAHGQILICINQIIFIGVAFNQACFFFLNLIPRPFCWLKHQGVCARLCIFTGATVHNVATGTLCQQVCVKTSSPPTSSLRAQNSCHKPPAIVQTCGGTERLPISHLSVSVVSPVSHTLRLFTGPREGNNRSVSCYTSH